MGWAPTPTTQAGEALALTWRGPQWCQSEEGPFAHATAAPVDPKRRRPPRPGGGGLGAPIAKEAPSPMRRGPRWSQSEGGPLTHAAWGLGGPKGMEAPWPLWQRPWRSHPWYTLEDPILI